MLLNATKCKGYSFHRFWVIKGKPTGRGKICPTPLSLPQPRLGLKQRRKTLFILNQYKTQNMCEKEMKSDQDCYEILEMYKKADDKYPYAWIFPWSLKDP